MSGPTAARPVKKGVQSIIDHLAGNNVFPRLRIGIGTAPEAMAMTDYVLANFNSDERAILSHRLEAVLDAVETWLNHGIEATMTQFNGQNEPSRPMS